VLYWIAAAPVERKRNVADPQFDVEVVVRTPAATPVPAIGTVKADFDPASSVQVKSTVYVPEVPQAVVTST
jgi:hypothetical protein